MKKKPQKQKRKKKNPTKFIQKNLLTFFALFSLKNKKHKQVNIFITSLLISIVSNDKGKKIWNFHNLIY